MYEFNGIAFKYFPFLDVSVTGNFTYKFIVVDDTKYRYFHVSILPVAGIRCKMLSVLSNFLSDFLSTAKLTLKKNLMAKIIVDDNVVFKCLQNLISSGIDFWNKREFSDSEHSISF